MSRNKIRTLLAIEPYKFTGKELGKLKSQYENKYYFDEHVLPTYCFREDNNKIARTCDYLQWVESGDESYILFYAETIDKLLSEEISNAGLDYLLKDVDLKSVVEKLKIHSFEYFKRNLPSAQYIIIDISYYRTSWEYEEYDMDLELVGPLKLNELEEQYDKF